jgi:Ca2+-binding EF-hand superfamily protein
MFKYLVLKKLNINISTNIFNDYYKLCYFIYYMSSIKDDLKKVFEIYDVDFDGFITKNDVKIIASELDFELNGSNFNDNVDKIDLESFIKIFNIKYFNITDKQNVINAFSQYDIRKNGTIHVTSIIQIINKFYGDIFGSDDVDELFKDFNIDNEGYLVYSVFIDMLE